MNKHALYFIVFLGLNICASQTIAVLKYDGGGDWYSNPTALKNLIQFCNTNIETAIDSKPKSVEAGSTAIFEYPFIHMTGHGNVVFSESESKNLRTVFIIWRFFTY